MEKVLTRLKEAGLRLRPSKCAFAQEHVEYPSPKVEAVHPSVVEM